MPWDKLLHDNIVLGAPLADGEQPITGLRPAVREETLHLSTVGDPVGEDAPARPDEDEEMGVDPSEINMNAEIAEGVVLKPSIGKAKAAAPPMPMGGAVAKAMSAGPGAAAKAAVPLIPSPEDVARGTSGLAKPKVVGSAWSNTVATHNKANEDKEDAESVATAERVVLRANESQIECAKAAKAIKQFQEAYPMVKDDNPASQTLIESFVSLSSDAPKAHRAAKDSKDGEIGKLVSESSSKSKADVVSRWRESAKRIAELARSGNLPAGTRPRMRWSSPTTGLPRLGTLSGISRSRFLENSCARLWVVP